MGLGEEFTGNRRTSQDALFTVGDVLAGSTLDRPYIDLYISSLFEIS